tara:strand:+ start:87 stop:785 length:699 start_codon:yes stop_codon:yes gene_type:complete
MAGFAGPNIVTDKLQFLVDSKNDQSYPGSGTTLTDITGNGQDLTLVNTPSITDGIITLDSDGFIRRTGSFMGTASQSNVSYNFIIRLNWGTFNGYKTIFGFQQSSFDRVANFVLNTNKDELEFDLRTGGTQNRNIFQYNMSDHKLKHTLVTYTFDSGTHKLYTNGILRSTDTASLTTFPAFTGTGGGFAVGNNLGSARLLGQGNFSYMSIYLKTLTPTEVFQNFLAIKGRLD